MATISDARATYGLSAVAALTGINVSGSGTVGLVPTTAAFTTATVAYSYEVTATGNSDVVTLTVATGALAKTTGTPNVTRWTGGTSDTTEQDIEGQTLGATSTLHGVLFEATTAVGGIAITSTGSGTFAATLQTGGIMLLANSVNAVTTIVLTMTATSNVAKVTIIGSGS